MKKTYKFIFILIIVIIISGCFNNSKYIDLVKNTKPNNIMSLFTQDTPTLGELTSNLKDCKYSVSKEKDNTYVCISWIDSDKNLVKIFYYVNLETSKVSFSKLIINDKEKNEIYYQGLLLQLINMKKNII